jgi:hypothetical protein
MRVLEIASYNASIDQGRPSAKKIVDLLRDVFS